MIRLLFFLPALAASTLHAAEDLGQLIFQDDFERSESQEIRDEPGQGWGTNSKSRANGRKQVDLKDGAMRIFIHAEADHAVSVTQPVEFSDGAVALRFRLDEPEDTLGLNFADLQFKEVHAGHLFAARVGVKNILLEDLKTGKMRLDIREARQTKGQLTEEQRQALVGKDKTFPHPVAPAQWHSLLVTVRGDTLSVIIDGQPVGSLSSPGIAHPTKRLLRLSVPRNAVIDDVKVWRRQ
jgi:hypothetical protein